MKSADTQSKRPEPHRLGLAFRLAAFAGGEAAHVGQAVVTVCVGTYDVGMKNTSLEVAEEVARHV